MPSTTATVTQTDSAPQISKLSLRGQSPEGKPIVNGTNHTTPVPGPDYPYARFLPTYDPNSVLAPLEPFEHVDPGHAALNEPNPRSFLDGAKENHLSPKFGSEIEGIQLSKLDAKAKGEGSSSSGTKTLSTSLPSGSLTTGASKYPSGCSSPRTFGRLHSHPTSGQPKEFSELHLVYKDGATIKGSDDPKHGSYYANRLTTTGWHSDVTYEEQPPGLTTLFLYATPESGGDTAYVSQVEAYNKLSPSFQAYLETLSVLHSGKEQADYARATGGVVKRQPVEHIHPLVRRHPVTGAKALFVNKGFSRRIIGLKQEESEAILNLLYAHIAQGQDFQVRASWKPRSVVLWDNRITAHSATGDFDPKKDGFRHGARITPQAEKPFL